MERREEEEKRGKEEGGKGRSDFIVRTCLNGQYSLVKCDG